MVDNDVISEAGLLEIMNAQPFAETRNDPMRVWQLFGERVHVGDAIKAILSLAGFNELREYRTAAGMFAIEKAEQRRIAESLKAENEALQQQLAAAREALQAMETRYTWVANELLACDYGDNARGTVGWTVYGWRFKGQRSIYGDSIDQAIDSHLATLQRDRQP